MEDLAQIIGLLIWPFLLGLIILYNIFFSSKKLKIKINPSTKRLELYIAGDKIGEVSTSIIQEIRLSQYPSRPSKNNSTEYTYSIVFEESTIGHLRSRFPKIDKMEKDVDQIGFRIESLYDQLKIRKLAEALSKSTGIPLRSNNGILRQAKELDFPYHEVMKGKVELDSFPPRYTLGDAFEISFDGSGLNLKSHSINYLLYFPLGFLIFMSFFAAIGSHELFYIDGLNIVFAFLFNSHIIFALFCAIYIPYRIHFPKSLRIEKGLLIYGSMKILVSKIEEVNLNLINIKFLTDDKTYKIFLPFFCHLKDLKQGADLIQKAILYHGTR